jgi:hypothetical protein
MLNSESAHDGKSGGRRGADRQNTPAPDNGSAAVFRVRHGYQISNAPTKCQSGETDIDGRISKIGDACVRAPLYEAANVVLTKPLTACMALKSWAKLVRRSGMKTAKGAPAWKMAVSGIGCWPMA